MKKISFVIVNYNTKDILKKCIENLINIYPEMEIIVVDNGSSDGSVEMVKKEYAEKVILKSGENNGLAYGNNVGLDLSNGEYVVYLGTDAFPSGDAVLRLYKFLEENPDVGIATPRLVLRDGGIDWDAHRGEMTPWSTLTHFAGLDKVFSSSKLFNQYYLGFFDLNTVHEIGACISHFMFVRRDIFSKVGRWDEEFFLFGEDIDFCYRVKQAGFKIMYVGDTEVLHYKGVTIKRKESKDISTAASQNVKHMRFLKGETTRAMEHFVNKHLKHKYSPLVFYTLILGIKLLTVLRLFLFDIKNRV